MYTILHYQKDPFFLCQHRDTIDLEAPFGEEAERQPIHKKAPTFDELSTSSEILETGIKVIDLLAPYLKGGKVGLFGGASRIDATSGAVLATAFSISKVLLLVQRLL